MPETLTFVSVQHDNNDDYADDDGDDDDDNDDEGKLILLIEMQEGWNIRNL